MRLRRDRRNRSSFIQWDNSGWRRGRRRLLGISHESLLTNHFLVGGGGGGSGRCRSGGGGAGFCPASVNLPGGGAGGVVWSAIRVALR